jgi:hypothetical protein
MKNNTSFFKVSLVCNMAPDIGCGSRSKPLLLNLENDKNIKEAWLNKEGTLMAIVCNEVIDKSSQLVIINSIFSKYNMTINDLNFVTEVYSFSSKNNWFRSNDVDKLSKEEALTLANIIVKVYHKLNPLTDVQKEKLQNETVNIFYDFFLTFTTFNQLSDTKEYRKLTQKIIKSSEQFINKEKIPNVEELLKSFSGHSENDINSSCCQHKE